VNANAPSGGDDAAEQHHRSRGRAALHADEGCGACAQLIGGRFDDRGRAGRALGGAELVQRPTGGITDFERWERYEKVPADETRPVPPGHGWWALVPTGTLEHAPDYGGLEHVPHNDWAKIW
jgi:hypothetical protein